MKKNVFILLSVLYPLTIASQAKYVFYFIGDGMGQNQVLATEMFLAEIKGDIGRESLCFTQFPVTGQSITFSQSNGITDSSAAGTALASGEKTKNGTLGLLPDGSPVHTIAEILHEQGWGVGITTSVSIDHATPGAFYAHVEKRNEYYKIGTQLATTGFDFFGGSTFYQPYPLIDKKQKIWDKTQPSLYQICRDSGYVFAHGYEEYTKLRKGAEKMILIQSYEGLTDDYEGTGMIPYLIDRKAEDLSLAQITEAAIDFLYNRHDNFFLMVEGGAIDWACHSNDAATAIMDVMDFDNAIKIAYVFYQKHSDETLIVVTADHETGGMALGNSDYTLNLQVLQHQKVSVEELSTALHNLHEENGKKLKWEQVCRLLEENLGLWAEVKVSDKQEKQLQKIYKQMKKENSTKNLYKKLDEIADSAMRILAKQSKLGWTTGNHSASAVGIWAIGQGAERFTGWQDNTQIAPKIIQATKKNNNE